jgi:hypothetical protein
MSGFSMRFQILLAASLVVATPATAQTGGQPAAAPYSDDSLQCLTQAVYYEARNQSADGQRAVAQVVLNRTRDPAYPRSVCGVVFQGAERYTGCQFSFTCDGSMNAWIEPYAWERAQGIAAAALSGSVYRPVGSATHYHTTAISPYWAPSLVQQAVIGAHVFYRRPGGSGGTVSQGRIEQVRVEEIPVESWSAPSMRASSGASGARRSRARPANLEIAVLEIPVVERPVRYRAQRAAATRSVSPRRAAPASGPSTRVESGVRVTRG